MNGRYWIACALAGLLGTLACGDSDSDDARDAGSSGDGDGDSAGDGDGMNADPSSVQPATFEEPLVESADIAGLAVLHSRPEQEAFYEAGEFAMHHPIAFIVQMAWDPEGYSHPLYVGLVNAARTRACLVGSRTVTYGGPAATEEDLEGRTFVIQTHVPEHCGPDALGAGPYDVWVGANRYVAANPDLTEDDDKAAGGKDLALLEQGNVVIFGADVTDLSGQDRGQACGRLVPGKGAFERTDEDCAVDVEVVASPGSNLLIDNMTLESSVALLTTTTTLDGHVICVQDKGQPLISGVVDLGLYGELPSGFGEDTVANDLQGPVQVVQRLCADDSGSARDTRCDRGDAPWIPLLVNPKAQSERAAWDEAAIGARFPGAPPPPPPVGADALEAGEFDDQVDDMSYLELRGVPQELMLPREACRPTLDALQDGKDGFVLETCVMAKGDAAAQDKAFGGERDNCIRQTLEMTENLINLEVDAAAPPPPPRMPPGPMPNSDSHSGGWLSVFNTKGSYGVSYGDSDWAKLVFATGYTVAGGTDGAYAGAYASAELSGEFDFDIVGLEIYADAHDSSNADGSEAIFEATRFGVSEGVGSSTDSAFSLRVSAWGASYEKCVDEKFGWWVVSIKIEGCASFTADVGGTLVGEFYLSNDKGNLEAVVGIVDVGPLIEAYMDGEVKVGDGCCSISVSGELDPLAYLSIGNDFYLIGEVASDGDLESLTFTADLVDMGLELVDGYIKLKVKFLGTSKSTKLINKDGWTWNSTLLSRSISL